MTDETRMSLAVAGRRRQTVHTAHHLAECSRKWRLRQETSDDRLLADGMAVPIFRNFARFGFADLESKTGKYNIERMADIRIRKKV